MSRGKSVGYILGFTTRKGIAGMLQLCVEPDARRWSGWGEERIVICLDRAAHRSCGCLHAGQRGLVGAHQPMAGALELDGLSDPFQLIVVQFWSLSRGSRWAWLVSSITGPLSAQLEDRTAFFQSPRTSPSCHHQWHVAVGPCSHTCQLFSCACISSVHGHVCIYNIYMLT